MPALLGPNLRIGLAASSIDIMGSAEASKGGAAGSLEATALIEAAKVVFSATHS
ncbi:hypothetical protein OUY36_06390 [Stutzerimonas sp. R40042]|uniref:hypothetical protein n=1 Tax=Pseudomonadaceae TaxID=135621 RepID=UPI000A6AEF27|nr:MULTISPECIES: hypothetical protein [Stutzerimonas]WAE63203.1 hypothetical protein OUY36_06390 [Stutzerimonas sp. R40042]